MVKNSISKKVLENLISEIYIKLLKEEPKPSDISKSLYLTCLSIRMLEKLGNTYPSQEEIDVIESMLKRFSSQKNIKPYFYEACLS